MKKIILIPLALLILNCMSEKVYFNTLAESKSSDTFDIEEFEKRKIGHQYFDTLKGGTVIRRTSSNIEYSEYETPPPPNLLEVYRGFHLNGKLKIKGIYYPNDVELGIWREYDDEGNLIKEENYDEGYEYSFEDVVKFLRLRGVDLFHRYTSITRNNGVWNIVYVKGDKYPKDIYDIDIDGKTGKVLSKAKNVFQEGS